MWWKSTKALLACALSLVLAAPAWAQEYGGGHREWAGHMGWWGPVGGLFMFLVMVAIVVGAILLVRTLWHLGGDDNRRGRASGGRRSGAAALDLLDQRYARGEIEREEYLRRRADLEG